MDPVRPVQRGITAMAAVSLLAVPVSGRADDVDRWQRDIAEASTRFAMPAAWIARVMAIESRGHAIQAGRPITSPAGAMGLMQVMPASWAMLRSRLGLGSDPYNPHNNILAGAFYLRMMYDRFGYPGLFGAYNAGPRRYAAWRAGAGQLPRETRSYMAMAAGSGEGSGGLRAPVGHCANRSARAGIFFSGAGPAPSRALMAPDGVFALRGDDHPDGGPPAGDDGAHAAAAR